MTISVVHATSGNSTSITIPSTTAGNCLVTCIASASTAAATVSGITLGGSAGNYAQLAHASDSLFTSFTDAFIWADPACAGGQTAVVISGSSLSLASGNGGVMIYEVSGLTSTIAALLDQSSTHGSTSAGNWTSNPAPDSTQASEIWVGVVSDGNGTLTGPSAWTNTSIGTTAEAGYQIVSSTGSAVYSGTDAGASRVYAAAVVTLFASLFTPSPAAVISQAVKRASLY
jgi:hypothetical protein